MNIYDFDVIGQRNEVISLEKYRGKVMLIINSATECGFTPQYDELQDMYEKFGDENFVILDFPCNQFGKQAPGSNEEIVTFCSLKFGIKFPIFAKIDVNGDNAAPLYKYLVEQKEFEGFDIDHPLTPMLESMLSRVNPNFRNEPDIKWNFTKFLIDSEGNVVERFEPTDDINLIVEKVKELIPNS